MKAYYLVEPGCIELRDVPAPHACDGEVVVKIEAALTCGTDIKAYRRGHPHMSMPTLLGHEFSGVIVEAGKNVRGYGEGDAVMAVHTAPCGACPYCERHLQNLCPATMRNKVLGAYAEYIKIPRPIVANNLFKKPDGLPYEEAALLEPLACVVHGMQPLDIQPEDTVLIVGAGAIGLLHLLLARAKGAANIAVAGKHRLQLQVAEELGADHIIDAQAVDLTEAILELTGGFGANWVFECTGSPKVWRQAVNMVSKGGAVILFGGCPAGTSVAFDAARLHYDEISLVGSFHFTPRDVSEAHRLLAAKQIEAGKLITGVLPLTGLQEAFDLLMAGKGVKFDIQP